jgi:hypothetical protein
MSEEIWGGEAEERYEYGGRTGTYVMVNGAEVDVTPGDPFGETVQNLSREAGFGKFRVVLNGTEVKPSESPSVVSEGDKIELLQYDVAGR